jgi:hypothetical protein
MRLDDVEDAREAQRWSVAQQERVQVHAARGERHQPGSAWGHDGEWRLGVVTPQIDLVRRCLGAKKSDNMGSYGVLTGVDLKNVYLLSRFA